MFADDFLMCGEGHALYENSSVIQWYKHFRKYYLLTNIMK